MRVEAEAGFARCGGGLRRAPPRAATGTEFGGQMASPDLTGVWEGELGTLFSCLPFLHLAMEQETGSATPR